MNVKEVFPGVFKINGKFATCNLAPGEKVYGEELVKVKGIEYRIWDPKRSKLCAALVKGLKSLSIAPGSVVLYLGAANGTTASHVSDIVGEEGRVYCVEFSPQAMRDLLLLAEHRANLYPVLADARLPDTYKEVEVVDIVYEDVADRSQTDILLRNFDFFKAKHFLIALKARCIDSAALPRKVYNEEKAKIAKQVKVNELLVLDPFERDHCMITGGKK